ncbi:MAG: sel1 repeat family protein [Methanomassiliicoccaceae archaeon]|nr:sel1 repeat family protein [Methanomassiliicoccaceae archaeon]
MMDRPLASANDDSDIRNAFAAARKLLDDPEHMEDAITELTALADRGCSEAMVCLGTVYLEGEDLQRKDEAAALFKKAADLGDSGGMRNLGYMHAVGIHTEKDKQKAIEWYTRSANAGNPRAQCNLGVIYNHGKYVPADHMEAVKWFSLSAMNGYSRGQTNRNNAPKSG